MSLAVISLVFAFAGGLALGVVFFGGLRLTLAQLPRSRRPALLLLVSFFARITVLAAGLWWIGGDAWQRYVLALAGILVARQALVGVARLGFDKKSS